MKNLPENTRILLFNRYYYEVKHKLIKDKKCRLIADKVYDANGRLLRKCLFKYLIDKPNFKIVDELITFYGFDNTISKRKIHYVVDYKKMSERHTHYDIDNYCYFDLKFHFDKAKNLLFVKEYNNKKLAGAYLYYDCNGVKLGGRCLYIRAERLGKALKMDKMVIEEFTKPICLMPMSDEDVEIIEITDMDDEEL